MRNAPRTAVAVLTCRRASATVYVTERPGHTFPFAVHSWDREYNDGEGQFVYENGFVELSAAVAEAGRIFHSHVFDRT